jgi:uncharacterized protein (TIGR03435 family)
MKSRAEIALGVAAVIGVLHAAQPQLQFEVASIKLDNGCENATRRMGSFSPSPGRLEMPCVTLQSLIQTAYGTFGDGVSINTQPLPTEGETVWMRSEHYSVSAKTDAAAGTEMLAGPMLQTLLEDRFRLKTHRETRETPVYGMTVGKGGLKVQPLAEGACMPLDLDHPPEPPKPGERPPNVCGVLMMRFGKGNMTIDVRGVTMAEFAQRLSGRVDRRVVDKTGVAGRFNFQLEFTPDPNVPGLVVGASRDGDSTPANDAGTSIFVALQEQLGLKLSADRGPVGYLIIDHAEKPTAN